MAAAFLGAMVAGFLLMAPLDLGRTAEGSVLQLDLMVLNMPRAAAAGAVFAVVTAALVIALGKRTAWVVALCSAAVLLVDQTWNRDAVETGSMTTVNYIDSIFSGILLGALAVAVFGKRRANTAFLIGALSSIVIADLTSLPAPGGAAPSAIERASSGSPSLWLLFGAVVALAVGVAVQRNESTLDDENADLPIGPIFAALLLVTSTAVVTEWFVRHAGTSLQLAAATVVILLAAGLAALFLPGRDGTLVLLAVAVANAGSAIVAVPRPDWTEPLPLVLIIAGLYAGRRWPTPRLAILGIAALSVFAALTAGIGRQNQLVPIIGITAVGLLIGYSFGVVTPRAAPSVMAAIAVLLVPCLVVAVRGSGFGRIAYSPRWYRAVDQTASAVPGWTALAVTAGCGFGIYLLYRLRPEHSTSAPLEIARRPVPQG
ncbi:hypothetical protein [Nocardia jejuensis]|uniref:hypothetical protein n=1 Tax=Nocardia jejuensis TaxID=328049 RepID=UPI0008342E9B|nr:hypothetical protein [Nocardia jejuensis]